MTRPRPPRGEIPAIGWATITWSDIDAALAGQRILGATTQQVIPAAAASLVEGCPLDLGQTAGSLDRHDLHLLLAAVAHAGGSHDHHGPHLEGPPSRPLPDTAPHPWCPGRPGTDPPCPIRPGHTCGRCRSSGTARSGAILSRELQDRLETDVVTQYQAGQSTGAIAQLVDRSQTVVRHVLTAHQVPRRPRADPATRP